MAGLEFNIDDEIARAEKSGLLNSKQVAELKKARLKTKEVVKQGATDNTVDLTGDTSKLNKAAGVAGIAGEALTKEGSQDKGSQAAGGALSGAASGFTVAGPWGAAVGGALGGVSGALQADANREKANNAAESKRVTNIGNIQNRASSDRSAQVNNIVNNLSRALLS